MDTPIATTPAQLDMAHETQGDGRTGQTMDLRSARLHDGTGDRDNADIQKRWDTLTNIDHDSDHEPWLPQSKQGGRARLNNIGKAAALCSSTQTQ